MLPDINLFHFTLPVALLFVGDWMTPTPSHRAHPFHRGGGLSLFYLYLSYFPFVILFDLVFKFMILTFILVTYLCIDACLAWNQLSSSYFSIHQHSSSYPTSYIAVGWRLDDPHPFPGPTHSTGGRGVDGLWPWPWQGGGGGGTRNLEHIYIHVRRYRVVLWKMHGEVFRIFTSCSSRNSNVGGSWACHFPAGEIHTIYYMKYKMLNLHISRCTYISYYIRAYLFH